MTRRGLITLVAALMALAALAAVTQGQDEADRPQSLWGYVDRVDGMAVLLDDGTTVQITDNTRIIRTDGAAGTPDDITRGVRADVALAADGNATRLELLPAPLAPEYYLTNLTVRGATTLAATVGDRTYPRSLSAIKASFVGRTDTVTLQGGVAYVPPKEGKAPAAALFSIVNPANDVLFQKTLHAGESSEFRLNFPAGRADTFTLAATPVGEGGLQPEWCLWLDPKLVGPLPAPGDAGVLRSTAQALIADLREALGEAQPGPMAVPLFVAQRIKDNQIMADLQEDLLVAAVGQFQVVGKSGQRPELGLAIPDGVTAELTKMGAKTVLTGTVSDRVEILVLNAALVDVESGRILATARATQ